MKIPKLLPRQTEVNSTIAVNLVHPKIAILDSYYFPITVRNSHLPHTTLKNTNTHQGLQPRGQSTNHRSKPSQPDLGTLKCSMRHNRARPLSTVKRLPRQLRRWTASRSSRINNDDAKLFGRIRYGVESGRLLC